MVWTANPYSLFIAEALFSLIIIVFPYIMLRGIDLRWKKLGFEPKTQLRFRHLSFTQVSFIVYCYVNSWLSCLLPTEIRNIDNTGLMDTKMLTDERSLKFYIMDGYVD